MADDDYCYLTTAGRRTGRAHRIEIWYAADGDDDRTLYLLAGGGMGSDWVRNLVTEPYVQVELDGVVHTATARVVDRAEEQERARTLVFDKYAPRYGGDLREWRQRALPVAIDLQRAG